MSFYMPMTAAGLERVKELWRELQRRPTTSARYQALVALIRTETSAPVTPTYTDAPRTKA
jgi:hypothetical protein